MKFLIISLLLALRLRQTPAVPAAATTELGVDAIISAFSRHGVVFLGESHHSKSEHEFIALLINDPRFAKTVQIIGVEFANSRYQTVLDRFIAGALVPDDSLHLVWRNTTVPMAWDSPVYDTFFRLVRSLNRRLPPEHRIRVLALDPPINWASVHSMDEFPRSFGYRDPDWFTVLDREALSQQKKVLVIAGAVHMLRKDPSSRFEPRPMTQAGLGEALAIRYPGLSYNVWPLIGAQALPAAMRGAQPGSLLDLATDPALGALNSHMLLPGSVTIFTMVDGKRVPTIVPDSAYPPLSTQADALLYIGPDTTRLSPPLATYRDTAYVSEMYRRSKIVEMVFGLDLVPTLDSIRTKLKRAPSRKLR